MGTNHCAFDANKAKSTSRALLSLDLTEHLPSNRTRDANRRASLESVYL
jgi:hypothetical protein